MKKQKDRCGGFTLIEVIVALVLLGIAGAMMVTLIDRSLTQINKPRETLSNAFSVQSVMENMVSRHAVLENLDQLSAEIGSENVSMDNSFGRYVVHHNHFVWFDGSKHEMISATNNHLLKVSIKNDLGEKITRLFTEDL